MTLVPLTDCRRMLGIDAKTLRKWLQHAHLKLSAHPTDARLKCLTIEQVQQLATLSGRPPLAPASAPPALLEEASARLAQEAPPPADPLPDAPPPQTPSLVSAPILPEADLLEKLACLERSVTTMQQHLAQLALELLQERTLRYEQRLQTLEALIQHTARPEALPPALQTMVGKFQPGEGVRKARRLHPAELRARSRVIPLLEYGAHGTYVVICPQEGELPLTPDSPAWFDWLATLSSFRFVGQQGRFTAYRKGSTSRCWSAYRTIHQHDYKYYLGVTDHLTIDCLEQMAAKLQSHLAAL